MNTEQAIRNRHSVRAFQKRQVETKMVDKLLDLAFEAPSGSNIQPFKLALATGDLWKKISSELVMQAKNFENAHEIPWSLNYPKCYKPRQRSTGFGLYNVLGITKENREAREHQFLENYRAFGAPAVVFVFSDRELGAYSTLDLGCWMQTFMLAAEANGVATIAQTALAAYPAVLKKYFNVPDRLMLACAISFGYEDKDAVVNSYRPGRAPKEDMMLSPRVAEHTAETDIRLDNCREKQKHQSAQQAVQP